MLSVNYYVPPKFPVRGRQGTAGRVSGTAIFFGDFGDGYIYRKILKYSIYIKICKYTCHSYETKHKTCHLNIIEL